MKLLCAIMINVLTVSFGWGQQLDSLKQLFRNPPLEYRMNKNLHHIPVDEDVQDSIINKTLLDGWGGFALNTSYNEYTTKKGFESLKLFIDKAKKNQMDLWLYDEKGYPSGTAGGEVMEKNEHWAAKAIFFKDTLVSKGNINFKLPPGDIISVTAILYEDGNLDYTKTIDLNKFIQSSALTWSSNGSWKILATSKANLYDGFQAERNPYLHASPFIAAATDKFIELTHDKYASNIPDLSTYFTSTFTDEPSSMALQFHNYRERHAVIPWQDTISNLIKERYGYLPEKKLVKFFYDEGREGQKIRYQYFSVVSELIANNYFGKIQSWCSENGILSGGHLLLEESLTAHVALYGDIMRCFRNMDAPGIDILSAMPENTPVYTSKLASSAAALEGNRHVMSEPCPIIDRRTLFRGKDPTTSFVRGHLNRLIQGGVTDFNCYLKLSNSTDEERVQLNEYVGRLELLLEGGYSAAEIGVVYPIESMWAAYRPSYQKVSAWRDVVGGNKKVEYIDKTFQRLANFMFANNWDYLFIDSKGLIDSKVELGKLVHNNLQLKVLILPAIDTMPSEAWQRVLQFVKKGGKLILLDSIPLNTESAFPSLGIQNEFQRLAEANAENIFSLSALHENEFNVILSRWVNQPLLIANSDKSIRVSSRKNDDYAVYFIYNDSSEEVSSKISFVESGTRELWNPSTGEITTLNNNHALIRLKPYDGVLVRISVN